MGTDDKVNNAAQDATGHVKEAVGNATGDDNLKADGQADQTESHLKKAGENVKDAFTK